MQIFKHTFSAKRLRHTTATTLIILAGAGTAMAGPLTVCGTYSSARKEITVFTSNGCVSSSYRPTGNDIKVEVDEHYATIRVSGGFRYEKPKTRIIKSDCGAGQKLETKIQNVAPRRYSVATEQGYLGVLDFTASHDRQCAKIRKADRQTLRTVRAGKNREGDPSKILPNPNGTTIQGIIAPLLRSLSVSGEGHGSLSLEIGKYHRNRGSGPEGAYADIKAYGLADDSVSGMHYKIDFVETADGWEAVRVRQLSLCARGSRAGQWTEGNCS